MSNKEDKKLIDDFESGRNAYTYLEKMQAELAFIQIKADLMMKFEDTGYKDDEDRREIWRKLQTVAWLEQSLTEIVNSGKMAEQELKRKGFFDKFKRK